MWELAIPGRPLIVATHLVLDINGTLTLDGRLLPGVVERLERLTSHLDLVLLTADTCGTARAVADELEAELLILDAHDGGEQKLAVIEDLGPRNVIAIGNGQNDALMLKAALLGIAVLQSEGLARAALLAADVVFASIADALDALLKPSRLVATLRT